MLVTELFTLPGRELVSAYSTLIYTQEDGNTMFSDYNGLIQNPWTPQAYFEVTFYGVFARRYNNLAPSFKVPGNPYSFPQLFSNRDPDEWRVTIQSSTTQNHQFTAVFKSIRWGGQSTLLFNLLPPSRTYIAYGPTIAFQPNLAVFHLAFRKP